MPRTIHADGRTVVVPDDATPDEVNQIFGPAPKLAPPAPLSGPIGPAPIPVGLQGTPSRGLASSPGEIARTVGSHALQAVAGPARTVLAPAQGTAEHVAQAFGPGALPLYRTTVEPSIAPARQALQQAGQGQYADAARSAESAIPVVGPWADQVERDVGQHGAAAGLAGLATDVLAPAAAGKLVAAVPAAAEGSARGMINTTVGARKADFARGANPGRGYLDANLGPTGSMQSIADKASDARDEVGQALGNAYSQADASGTLIPSNTVRQAINPIIDSAKSKASGPGVIADPGVYETLKDSFESALQAADAKGGFTPSELWNIRKNMNESLNWGDQSKLNLTKTQQRVSGALGGVLEDAVPDVADLNQNYQDLSKLHGRASERAATGSQSLTNMAAKAATSAAGALLGGHTPEGAAAGAAAGAALNSVPARTTIASGLAATGKALAPAGEMASGATLPATLAAVSGDNHPDNPENGPEDKAVPNVAQSAPSAQSITPEPTPDTHSFSTSEWLKGNPDGDPDEAKDHAQSLGYVVTD
jgi:hypothetical protein